VASIKVPVEVDYSVGKQDFLDITDKVIGNDVEYTVQVRGADGGQLYSFKTLHIKDKTSLSVLMAQHMAKDPYFGFGRDQRPYRWTGSRWEPVDKWFSSIDYSLHALIRTTTQRRSAGDSFYSEALAAWQANSAYHQDGLELKAFGKCPGIPFLDGVWSLAWGKGELMPHDPQHLNTRVLPLTVAQASEHYLGVELGDHDDSLLMKFLRSTLDEDQLVTIRRWFGYHLLSNRLPNAEKFLYLYGSGSNGKSQLLHLLRGLVGKESCAELRLSDLKVSASLERLVGALAMIGSEASTKTEMETLKLLVSREPLHCNPKYRDPFDIEPECLVSQASNYPPHFEDTSSAMARRVIALHLTRTFKESEDRIEDLAQRIVREEYPLLVGFALAGAHEISEMGRFEVPASIKEHSTQEVSAGNPVEAFGALLEFGPFEVESRELYAAYKRWSLDSGARPLKELEFKTALERFATKNKRPIDYVRMLTGYKPSTWINERQERVLVYPSLADRQSRPYGYRGVRLAAGHFGESIGIEMPDDSSARRAFEA
jgi:P4 family phage/plasmid primase-like protien